MIRSLLYVPAGDECLVAKACEHGADALLINFGDAPPSMANFGDAPPSMANFGDAPPRACEHGPVTMMMDVGDAPPTDRSSARAALARSIAAAARSGSKVFVRISSRPEFLHGDAEAACRAGAFGLCIPKARDPDLFADLAAQLAPVERSIGRNETVFLALIEDTAALLDARAIAASPRVVAVAANGDELARDMAAAPSPAVLHFPRLMVHYAAKAEGKLSFGLLRALGTQCDHDAIAAAVDEAKAFGFDGAVCLHPSAVPLFNAGFSPTLEEVASAGRIRFREAGAAAEGGGIQIAAHHPAIAPVVARAGQGLDFQVAL